MRRRWEEDQQCSTMYNNVATHQKKIAVPAIWVLHMAILHFRFIYNKLCSHSSSLVLLHNMLTFF